jgi:(p)ppGpp synthase/HD superfamily hydrolase
MDLDQALELAELHHRGQVDKAGQPYICHVHRVVGAVDKPEEKLAAALHDLLEDTDITAAKLLAEGCPREIVRVVEALSRRKNENYEDFVRRAAQDPIARAVKKADVADNASEERLALLPVGLAARLRDKYIRAIAILDAFDTTEPASSQSPLSPCTQE